jgi:catechol 2,3-dioxygenase-like lactoylglutathione lyase family enzyme
MNHVPAGDPQVRIGSVVLDCVDLERMVAFWCAALGYGEGDRTPRFVRLDIDKSAP